MPAFYYFSVGIENKNPNGLTEADYDFSAVKSEERLACIFYEYARESGFLRAEVSKLREKWGESSKSSGQVLITGLGGVGGQMLVVNLGMISGFPNTAWTRITDNERNKWFKFIENLPNLFSYATTSNNPPVALSRELPDTPDTMTLEQWKKRYHERLPSIPKTDVIKYGFYAINLKYPKTTLLHEFLKMLYSFEGKPVSETPSLEKVIVKQKRRAGRQSHKDVLKALAALRLRYHYKSFESARKIMKPMSQKGTFQVFYGHRESFQRACKSAVRHFKFLYGWFDKEPPIHFKARNKNRN